MAEYRELLYMVREELLKTDKEYWMSLNTLYPHMKVLIKKHYQHKNLFILSTKKQELIIEILNSHNIRIEPERVIDSGKTRKLEIISDILNNSDTEYAVFIDDQIAHLTGIKNKKIEVYLAEWGYVKKEWFGGSVKTISKEQIMSFF